MIRTLMSSKQEGGPVLSPYERFDSDKLILRDELAIDRTLLANERTLLSYLRSGVALIIAGITIIHYATQQWFMWSGVMCIPFGILAAVYGILRYRKMQNAISRTLRWSHSE